MLDLNRRGPRKVYQQGLSTGTCACGACISEGRMALGYTVCLTCGENKANEKRHTVVPMPKSNYILVTDLSLLKGLNSSHKGGIA